MKSGTKEPTKTNTYKAANGEYYDPTKLESYFITNVQVQIAILKEFYSIEPNILDYANSPFLKISK